MKNERKSKKYTKTEYHVIPNNVKIASTQLFSIFRMRTENVVLASAKS